MRHVLGGLVFKKCEAFYLRVPLDHDTPHTSERECRADDGDAPDWPDAATRKTRNG